LKYTTIEHDKMAH